MRPPFFAQPPHQVPQAPGRAPTHTCRALRMPPLGARGLLSSRGSREERQTPAAPLPIGGRCSPAPHGRGAPSACAPPRSGLPYHLLDQVLEAPAVCEALGGPPRRERGASSAPAAAGRAFPSAFAPCGAALGQVAPLHPPLSASQTPWRRAGGVRSGGTPFNSYPTHDSPAPDRLTLSPSSLLSADSSSVPPHTLLSSTP